MQGKSHHHHHHHQSFRALCSASKSLGIRHLCYNSNNNKEQRSLCMRKQQQTNKVCTALKSKQPCTLQTRARASETFVRIHRTTKGRKKNPKQLTAAVLKKKVKTHKRLNRTPFNLTKQHRVHGFEGIIFFKATNNAMSRSHPSGSTNWQQLSGSFLYCSWLSRRWFPQIFASCHVLSD